MTLTRPNTYHSTSSVVEGVVYVVYSVPPTGLGSCRSGSSPRKVSKQESKYAFRNTIVFIMQFITATVDRRGRGRGSDDLQVHPNQAVFFAFFLPLLFLGEKHYDVFALLYVLG